jgi:hypothetical protein
LSRKGLDFLLAFIGYSRPVWTVEVRDDLIRAHAARLS